MHKDMHKYNENIMKKAGGGNYTLIYDIFTL